MRVIVPPIKSQGIKTKLVPWIQSMVPAVRGRWIEPFFGTGVVAFNVGFREAILGDINPHIIQFYQGVKNGEVSPRRVREYLSREGELLRKAGDEGYEHFRFVRNRFNKAHSPLDFLFLSRAGFNGMMRFNKKGEWNIPFCKKLERFSPSYITKITNQVHNVACLIKPEWTLVVEDFEQVICQATKDDFIYCDPPYIGRYVDYYSGWTEKDEQRLFKLLSSTPARFILSTWHHNDYRENEYVAALWGKFNVVTRDHFYHSGAKLENRRSVVEALVYNFAANISTRSSIVKPKPEQMLLMERREEYIAKQIDRVPQQLSLSEVL